MAAVDYRYAHALAAVVAEQKLDVKATEQQLADFQETLESSAELREVLENPSIVEAQKLKVLDGLKAKLGLSQAVRNFIAVITHHQRLSSFAEIVATYVALSDEEANVADVEVVTARELAPASRTTLEAQIAKLVDGRKVSASYTQDAELLGGAIVKIGSTVYDGSVRGQLQQLKQRLLAVTV
jgi:F-type H+-transporting ATPase subunit delta